MLILTDVFAIYVSVLFVTYSPIIQIVLLVWRSRHPVSYRTDRPSVLCVIPIALLCSVWYMYGIVMWTVVLCWLTILLVSRHFHAEAKKRYFNSGTPNAIFSTFRFFDWCCFAFNCIGVALLLISLPFHHSPKIVSYSLGFLIHGVYLGLLSHVFGEYLITRMAEYQGVGIKGELPSRGSSPSECLLCGQLFELSDMNISTLACEHRYHETCIKGWMLMGHIEECPACKKTIKYNYDMSSLDRLLIMQHVVLARIVDYFVIVFWILLALYVKVKTNSEVQLSS